MGNFSDKFDFSQERTEAVKRIFLAVKDVLKTGSCNSLDFSQAVYKAAAGLPAEHVVKDTDHVDAKHFEYMLAASGSLAMAGVFGVQPGETPEQDVLTMGTEGAKLLDSLIANFDVATAAAAKLVQEQDDDTNHAQTTKDQLEGIVSSLEQSVAKTVTDTAFEQAGTFTAQVKPAVTPGA